MKFKRRVKAPPEMPAPRPRTRRSWVPWAGVAAWVVTTAVCLAIVEDWEWPGAGDGDVTGEQGAVVGGDVHDVGRGHAVTSGVRSGARPNALLPLGVGGPPRAKVADSAPSSSEAVGSGAPPTTSCEGAIATHRDRAMAGQARGAERITRGRFQSEVDNGTYFRHCAVPENMGIDVCAAIQGGRAVGVTVQTTPEDARVRACVAAGLRAVEFAPDARLDVTHGRFSQL